MATIVDVAAYILHAHGPMTAMKLQKLVYYAQAWSLVWDEKPLFRSRIEAWANGPVAPALYREHKGMFKVRSGDIPGDRHALTDTECKTVIAVVRHYGNRSSQYLSSLTHVEPPWKDARRGLEPGERGSVEITHAAMAAYYGAL